MTAMYPAPLSTPAVEDNKTLSLAWRRYFMDLTTLLGTITGGIVGPVGPQGPQGPAGATGPAGPQGQPGQDAPLPPTDPVITRTGDLVTRIDYSGGRYKVFTYTATRLDRIDYIHDGVTTRKDLHYTGGLLTSITQTEF